MTPEFHRDKARRIKRAMRHFTARDYEAVIEGCMLAGTHWFNAALHRFGLRPDDHDVLHAEYLHNADRVRIDIAAPRMLKAIDEIEASRALYVRGNVGNGGRAARRALRNLEIIEETARKARPIARGRGVSPNPR